MPGASVHLHSGRSGGSALIRHPNGNFSEFEVQAYIYWSLRALGHDARGEVVVRAARCRFDILVFLSGIPVLIIEVKKRKGIPCVGDRSARRKLKMQARAQIKKYSQYGLPLLTIHAMKEARAFIESVKQLGHIPSPDGGSIPPNSQRPIKPASRPITGTDESTGTGSHPAGFSEAPNSSGDGAHAPQVNSTTEKMVAL